MRHLHLVKHAPVNVEIGIPSDQWRLAPEADGLARTLAARFRGLDLRRVVTSPEPKAAATGRILAEELVLPAEARAGLEEHHRLVSQQSGGADAFRENVRRLFAAPDRVVFGTESADAALARFRAAVNGVMAESDNDELIVTHGTVMTLLITAGGGGDPMETWSALALPDHVVLEWPSLRRLDT